RPRSRRSPPTSPAPPRRASRHPRRPAAPARREPRPRSSPGHIEPPRRPDPSPFPLVFLSIHLEFGAPSQYIYARAATYRTRMPKETILVIEDDSDIVEIIQYNFEREGYRVITASNGEKGIDAVISRKPALIILDLMLPGLDGL